MYMFLWSLKLVWNFTICFASNWAGAESEEVCAGSFVFSQKDRQGLAQNQFWICSATACVLLQKSFTEVSRYNGDLNSRRSCWFGTSQQTLLFLHDVPRSWRDWENAKNIYFLSNSFNKTSLGHYQDWEPTRLIILFPIHISYMKHVAAHLWSLRTSFAERTNIPRHSI